MTCQRTISDVAMAYVTAALWAEGLDRNYDFGDVDPESLATMVRECEEFAARFPEQAESDPESFGHDFWLTRNRHGAGFWDGDWPEPFATQATEAAHMAWERSLYVGDDGRIYQS